MANNDLENGPSGQKRSLKNRKWLRAKEASEYLGISVESLRNMVSQGRIFPGKYLGRLYFSIEEIDRCIEVSKERKFRCP